MNCAPSLDIVRKSFAAPLSMNVTSLSSTMHARPLRVRATLLQIDLSSLTQGPNRRPCKTHRISVGVSVMVIFSTFPSLASASDATACFYRKQAGQWCLQGDGGLIRCCFAASFLAHWRLLCACGLRCHRIQKRLRPSATASGRCLAHGWHQDSRQLKDRESCLGQIHSPGP